MSVSHAPAPVQVEVSSLLEMLGGIADPRDRRGVRHGLAAVLGVAVIGHPGWCGQLPRVGLARGGSVPGAVGAAGCALACSYAGRAASLRTPTATLPTSSPAGATTWGLRGVSHASLPPHNQGVWTEEPTRQPAGHYLQTRSLRARSRLTSWPRCRTRANVGVDTIQRPHCSPWPCARS